MTLEITHITEKVRTNLVYYNLWSNLEIFECGECQLIRAEAPKKEEDSQDQDVIPKKQWVIPVDLRQKITMKQVDQIFEHIKQIQNGSRPAKIILGIYSDDGTIMYYTVSDGITKPRKS